MRWRTHLCAASTLFVVASTLIIATAEEFTDPRKDPEIEGPA
jgi:hypothetical protein